MANMQQGEPGSYLSGKEKKTPNMQIKKDCWPSTPIWGRVGVTATNQQLVLIANLAKFTFYLHEGVDIT